MNRILFLLAMTAVLGLSAETPLVDDSIDEIDLEDDAALAAQKPQITAAEKTEGPVALVDIECDEATLADILRQFRKTTGANIISGESTNLQRRVSVSLKHVPWRQGLQAILNSRGFRLDERENIFRVVEDFQTTPLLTRTFQLNHASCAELADLFNASYAAKDSKGKVLHPIASSFAGANVVVVTAPEKVISDCEAIIKSVDKAVAQIYIEARFLELSTEAMHKLGLQWNSLESWGVSAKNLSADFSLSSARTTSDGYKTAQALAGSGSREGSSLLSSQNSQSASEIGSTWSTATADSSESSSKGAGSFSLSRDSNYERSKNTANNIGFSGQLSASDFTLALSAFEQLEDARIFSNPKVIVSNGKEANVDMTTKFPNVRLTSQRNNSDYGSYLDMSAQLEQIQGNADAGGLFAGSCFFEWGITLCVKPRISPDGLISVEITPTISQLNYDIADGGSSSGYYEIQSDASFGKYPIISMKRINTDFTMKDGSTAVIGGLSRTTEDDVDSGIPYLRKIPWIGPKLFGWKSRQKVQKEIIICVTIGIANPEDLPSDIGLPTNAIIGREYVSGKRLEPGLRKGPAAKILKLDMSALEDRHSETSTDEPAKGEVKITPAKGESVDLLSNLNEEAAAVATDN